MHSREIYQFNAIFTSLKMSMTRFGYSLLQIFFPSILQVSQVDLHRHFHALGAGSIEEVRVQRDKGFGFVRYSTHAEAAMAISMGNAQSYLCGKQIKVGPRPVFVPFLRIETLHN